MRYETCPERSRRIRNTKHAFTLVEILIVVAILGIMAAIVVPTFKGHITKAKESAAKDNLRIWRSTIERYAAQHNGVSPGYPGDDPSQSVGYLMLTAQLVTTGNYLPDLPINPFNNKNLPKLIQNNDNFPAGPVQPDIFGWIYKATTKEIRLNWLGTDSAGIAYFDY